MMTKALAYSDIYLIPRYSELTSRSKADISVEFLGRKWAMPVLPANMETVISEDHAKWLSENGYFYIMHRFNGSTRKLLQRARAEAWKTVSISIGVQPEDYDLISGISESKCRVDFITIDVAHGHHLLVRNMIGHIKTTLPNAKIIAGNVCTPEAIKDLADWGADAAKVGIAGGHACSTKNMTGFHVPMFTCVNECVKYGGAGNYRFEYIGRLPNLKSSIPIIADGGVRENGDIPKALVAGATMVMCGGLFAACIDAPGETIYAKRRHIKGHMVDDKNRPLFKGYHGSASAKQKGKRLYVEGFELQIPCNNLFFEEKLQEIKQSLQSAISYAGGDDLNAFKNVKFLITK